MDNSITKNDILAALYVSNMIVDGEDGEQYLTTACDQNCSTADRLDILALAEGFANLSKRARGDYKHHPRAKIFHAPLFNEKKGG